MDFPYNPKADDSQCLQLRINELLLSCHTLDREVSVLLQTVAARTKALQDQQLTAIGMRLAKEQEARQSRQRVFVTVLRYRQQEEKLHRLQQEASCLVQVLQQQQQYMAFLRAEDQNFRQRSHEQHVTTFLCPCRKELF